MTDDRDILERARYLARTTDLSKAEALSLAYREQGYTHSWIAREIDAAETTVATYMNRIAARYGFHAVETKPTDARGDLDIESIDETYPETLGSAVRAQWLAIAREHADRIPGDWIHDAGFGGDVGR